MKRFTQLKKDDEMIGLLNNVESIIKEKTGIIGNFRLDGQWLVFYFNNKSLEFDLENDRQLYTRPFSKEFEETIQIITTEFIQKYWNTNYAKAVKAELIVKEYLHYNVVDRNYRLDTKDVYSTKFYDFREYDY